MGYAIEKLAGEPILMVMPDNDFNRGEGPRFTEELFNALEGLSERVYLIANVSNITPNMDDILEGSNLMTRGQKPPYAHPNVIETLFVTSSSIMRLAAKGLASPVFGNLQIRVVGSVDEALAYCRQQQPIS